MGQKGFCDMVRGQLKGRCGRPLQRHLENVSSLGQIYFKMRESSNDVVIMTQNDQNLF